MANLSGEHLNAIEDRIVERAMKAIDVLAEAFTADGPPYGTEEATGRDLYDNLVALRDSGDPAYWDDPAAAAALMKLSELYGAPPAQVAPFEYPGSEVTA